MLASTVVGHMLTQTLGKCTKLNTNAFMLAPWACLKQPSFWFLDVMIVIMLSVYDMLLVIVKMEAHRSPNRVLSH